MSLFRPADVADTDAVVALMRTYYRDEGYPFDETTTRAAVAELLATPSLGRIWVANDDEAVVAYVVLTIGFSLEYGGRDAFIDDVYVARDYRGRGFGKAALALVEAACRELGVRALHLEVERHKGTAKALYRRSGFVDHDRYLMTKQLDDDLGTPST